MKPMLCQKATIDEAKSIMKSGNWIVEKKYDGVRGYIQGGRLYDRRGKEITHRFPEFEGLERLDVSMDGEIIAQSGQFNDISGRVHLRDKFLIKLSAKKSPARFVAFDCPEVSGSITDRKEILKETIDRFGFSWLENAPFCQDLEGEWTKVLNNSEEGLVIKRVGSLYEDGKRSTSWLKVKAFVETKAVFTKFEDHPRGITIETDDGRRVVVNGSQADDVRQAIEQNGSVLAEIQYLPQVNSDAWRFPSFRGVA